MAEINDITLLLMNAVWFYKSIKTPCIISTAVSIWQLTTDRADSLVRVETRYILCFCEGKLPGLLPRLKGEDGGNESSCKGYFIMVMSLLEVLWM